MNSKKNADTTKSYTLTAETPNSTSEFKQIFYDYYKTLPNNTQMSIFLKLGWHSSLVGFKSDNNYGAYLVVSYGEEPSRITGTRISINKGVVVCYNGDTPI